MFVHRLIRYLFRSKTRLNHGGRLISPYSLVGANEDEKLLILAGIARSPQDARFLFKKYRTNDPSEVLKRVPARTRGSTVRERIVQMIRRFEGHDPSDPIGKPHGNTHRIDVRYRYRRTCR